MTDARGVHIVLPVGSTIETDGVDAGPNWLAKIVASAGYFCAGGVVSLAGFVAGMFSAPFGTALLAWGFASLIASVTVWTHGAHATAGRVLTAFGMASAIVLALLGFTEGGEIAFGASALFVVAALGAALDTRSA